MSSFEKKGQKIQKIYNDQITELIIYTKINFKKKTQNLLIIKIGIIF